MYTGWSNVSNCPQELYGSILVYSPAAGEMGTSHRKGRAAAMYLHIRIHAYV